MPIPMFLTTFDCWDRRLVMWIWTTSLIVERNNLIARLCMQITHTLSANKRQPDVNDVPFKKSYLSRVSANFFSLNEYLSAELNQCRIPLLEDTTLDDMQCFLRRTLEHLSVLDECLDIEVESEFCTPYSKESRIERAGSHRVIAATLSATALSADCPVVVDAFDKTHILPKVMSLALKYPYCSALHAAALKLVSTAISTQSGGFGLWKQLLQTPGGKPSNDVWRTVYNTIQAAAAPEQMPGKHPLAGFCLKLSSLFLVASTDAEDSGASWRRELQQALQSLSGWDSVCGAEDSPLAEMTAVQEAYLGGPPPDPADELFMGGGSDNMQITGSQLLALLRGLNANMARGDEG